MKLSDAISVPRVPRAISVFSGMEAASVAAHPLGWKFVSFAEVEPAACWTLDSKYGCGRPISMPDPFLAETIKEQKNRSSGIRAVSKIPAAAQENCPVNLGDVTQVNWEDWAGKADVMMGGPPCQSFSYAGLRGSLKDARGNLTLSYVRAIHAVKPLWILTENVPGWLKTPDNAFGCFLGALVGADSPLPPPAGGRWGRSGFVDGPLYRATWRIVDAQGFVGQRRRRVFVVGSRVGSGGDPIRVLFETEAEVKRNLGERADRGPLFPVGPSVCGNPPSRGEAWKADNTKAACCTSGGSDPIARGGCVEEYLYVPDTATTLRARDAKGSPDSDCTSTLVAVQVSPSYRSGAPGFEEWLMHVGAASGTREKYDRLHLEVSEYERLYGRDCEVSTIAFTTKDSGADAGLIAPTMRAGGYVGSHANSGVHIGICVPETPENGTLEAHATETGHGFWRMGPASLRVTTAPSQPQTIVKQVGTLVRRLIPDECLALQGFPKNYLDGVKVNGRVLADGPRFKMVGNSWCVDVAAWIFGRMDLQLSVQLGGFEPTRPAEAPTMFSPP